MIESSTEMVKIEEGWSVTTRATATATERRGVVTYIEGKKYRVVFNNGEDGIFTKYQLELVKNDIVYNLLIDL